MLKIWLTWLQPSLGLLGMMLVLSSPLYSLAAQKPTAVGRATKAIQPKAIQPKAIAAGTNGTEVQLAGIAATPELAVRQLAVSSLTPSNNNQASELAAKARQQSNRDALDSFLIPSTQSQNLSSKATKQKFVKRSVNPALARTAKPKTTPPVTGLFIGNSNVRGASRFSPSSKQSVQPIVASTEIGAPTSLSAMMAANKAVDPFPVVRPELMKKLGQAPALAKVPTSKPAPPAVDPIATMPSGITKAQQQLNPSAATTTKLNKDVPHSLDPIAKIPSGFHQEVPHSLDPIAAIPSGLQRLLGNNLNGDRPAAPVRIAKTTVTKANSLLALDRLTAPVGLPELNKGVSLQLATAQAYISAPKFNIPGERPSPLAVLPKFDIPGERLSTVTLAKPATKVGAAKDLQTASLVATARRKTNYVAMMRDSHLEPRTKQAWTLAGERTNLGGLILGAQSPVPQNNRVGIVPTSDVKTTGSHGLSGIQPSPIN